MDELDIEGETIGVAPVGCSVISLRLLRLRHDRGRPRPSARAVATAVKRVHPDKVVFAYQGDGDLASIGMPRRSMRPPEARTSPSSSSTTPSTA